MIGILCGLESEAAVARRVAGACVGVSAARSQQARWAARKLVEQGATRLLSFGLAGGLEPGLPAGTIIVGTAVKSRDGQQDADGAWSAKLMQQIPHAQCGAIWGSEMILTSVQSKRALYESSRCLAVDMESHCVAQIAKEAGVPFAIVRVITDPSEMGVPAAALTPLRKDGRVNVGQVLWNLLRQPLQLPALIHLGINTGKAMDSLRNAVAKIS